MDVLESSMYEHDESGHFRKYSKCNLEIFLIVAISEGDNCSEIIDYYTHSSSLRDCVCSYLAERFGNTPIKANNIRILPDFEGAGNYTRFVSETGKEREAVHFVCVSSNDFPIVSFESAKLVYFDDDTVASLLRDIYALAQSCAPKQ